MMKFILNLILGLSVAQAQDAPNFRPQFIVQGKLESFPGMILDDVLEPEALREAFKNPEARLKANATAMIVNARPFLLDKSASKLISELLSQAKKGEKENPTERPLIGPHRAFALLNGDGEFQAILLDYQDDLIVTKVHWVGDTIIQTDTRWSRSIESPQLREILDLVSGRSTYESPFQVWMNGDRHHKIADRLIPQDKEKSPAD